ncbi:MAG: DUF2520 domain-containing protein [Ignavibacteriaceae bacterium]|nr:DUF2520 domain-containing protein [Ignavibacteriaceae bacterium]
MKFSKKDSIVIIGAGKIAYSLAPALIDSGYNIQSIISNNEEDARILASKLKIKHYSNNPGSLRIDKGIFILSVPDNQIIKTAEQLSNLKIDFPHSLFIHLSGSYDASLLKRIAGKKGYTASFHIMQTFPSRKKRSITNSFSAIETISNEANDYLFKLSKNLKLNPFRLKSGNKVLYHLAGVYASNFINASLFQSQQLFEMSGIKEYSFNDIFAPIFLSTAHNIKKNSPAKALSGPVERGDLDTIKKHIREIKRLHVKMPDLLYSYLSSSLLLIDASLVKFGKLTESHHEIKKMLLKELSELK